MVEDCLYIVYEVVGHRTIKVSCQDSSWLSIQVNNKIDDLVNNDMEEEFSDHFEYPNRRDPIHNYPIPDNWQDMKF